MRNFMWFLLGVLYVVGNVCMWTGVPLGSSWDRYTQFKSPDYSPAIYAGHVMARTFFITSAVWTWLAPFIAWSTKARGKDYKFFAYSDTISMYLVCLDLGLGVSFFITAVVQSRYLPRPLGKCENLDQLGRGGKNWLDVLVEAQSSNFKDKLDVCINELRVWQMVIACGIILCLCSLIRGVTLDWYSFSCMNWIAAVPTWTRYLNRRIQRRKQTKHKVKERTFMQWAQLVIQQRRFPCRSMLAGDVDLELGLQLGPLITASKTEFYLIRLLDTYEMAKAIASDCHYSDFRNLMLVSKGVRFAAKNCMSDKLLKRITCTTANPDYEAANRTPPKDCWGCGNMICAGCTLSCSIPLDKAFHLQCCSPYCSRCFRSRYCFPRSRKFGSFRESKSHWLPDTCLGHGSRPLPPNVELSTPAFDVNREFRELCSLCNRTDWEEIAARRRWTGWMKGGGNLRVLGPRKTATIECISCKKGIRVTKGQWVWWACRACGNECAEEFHDEELRAQIHGKLGTGPAA